MLPIISRMWNHELRKMLKGKYHLEFVQLIHYVNSIFTLSKTTTSTKHLEFVQLIHYVNSIIH